MVWVPCCWKSSLGAGKAQIKHQRELDVVCGAVIGPPREAHVPGGRPPHRREATDRRPQHAARSSPPRPRPGSAPCSARPWGSTHGRTRFPPAHWARVPCAVSAALRRRRALDRLSGCPADCTHPSSPPSSGPAPPRILLRRSASVLPPRQAASRPQCFRPRPSVRGTGEC